MDDEVPVDEAGEGDEPSLAKSKFTESSPSASVTLLHLPRLPTHSHHRPETASSVLKYSEEHSHRLALKARREEG